MVRVLVTSWLLKLKASDVRLITKYDPSYGSELHKAEDKVTDGQAAAKWLDKSRREIN